MTEYYDENTNPGRRRGDQEGWHRFVRANWYRDVWLFLITVISVLAIFFGVNQNNDRINDINAGRYDVLVKICKANNDRHDAAIVKLDSQIAQLPPAQQARAKTSRDFTVALIDALVPKQNCETNAARLVPQGD